MAIYRFSVSNKGNKHFAKWEFIVFPDNLQPETHKFTVVNRNKSFSLTSSFQNETLNLELLEEDAKLPGFVANTSTTQFNKLKKVTALKDNGSKFKMQEKSKGHWGPASWPLHCQRVHNVNGRTSYSSHMRPSAIAVSLLVVLNFEPEMKRGQEQVLNHLGQLLQTCVDADVDFVVMREKISGHTLIVRGGSPVLEAMFDLPMLERDTKRVEIEDILPNVFRQLLSYIYTGNAPNSEDDDMTEPLLIAADKYQIESLKERCSRILAKKLNADSAVRLLILSDLHSDNQLKEDVLSFFAKNAVVFWDREEFKKLSQSHPELFFESTKRMVHDLTTTSKTGMEGDEEGRGDQEPAPIQLYAEAEEGWD